MASSTFGGGRHLSKELRAFKEVPEDRSARSWSILVRFNTRLPHGAEGGNSRSVARSIAQDLGSIAIKDRARTIVSMK